MQRGCSKEPAPSCEVLAFMAPDEVHAAIARARIVITHGGPASILQALSLDKVPVVVPRSAAYGEHVDNHQIAFGRRIADRVHLCEQPSDLATCIERHESVALHRREPLHSDRSRAFADALGRLVDELLNANPR